VQKPEVSDDGKQAFLSLAGQDGEIDAFELQKILDSVFLKGKKVCLYAKYFLLLFKNKF